MMHERPRIDEIVAAFDSGEITSEQFDAFMDREIGFRMEAFNHSYTQYELAQMDLGEVDALFLASKINTEQYIARHSQDFDDDQKKSGCNPLAWVSGLFHRANR